MTNFSGDCRHAFRQADSQIDDITPTDFLERAAFDDLALGKLHRFQRWKLRLAGNVIIVERLGEGLLVVRSICDYDVIDQNARHAHGLGIGNTIANLFDLRDDDSAMIFRRLRYREYFTDDAFALET